MNEITNPVAVMNAKYRNDQGMTYRAFADALNEHLINMSITHASIINWEKGMTEPETDFLLNCMVVYEMNDWRTQWAIDCLCAKLPAVFERDEERKLLILSRAAHGVPIFLPEKS